VRVYTLTIEISGQGTTDPVIGTHKYPEGTVVVLTALAKPGWEFDYWGGTDNNFINPTTVTMTSDKTVTAYFKEIRHSLTINIDGQGTTNPSSGSYSYVEGRVINITATPELGWQFSHWSGDATGSQNPIAITMDSDKTVTAHFVRVYTLTIEISGQGTVTIDPISSGIHTLTIGVEGQGRITISPLSGSGSYNYTEGTIVTLTATPEPGWQFDYWNGDINGTLSPINITMVSDMTVTAHFVPPYKIYGLSFGPYTKEGQNPELGATISEEQIRELLMNIREYTTWIKTYGCANGLEVTGRVAHEFGLKIAVGAWLSDDLIANEEQISSLIAMAQAGEADILIVGNEVLLRNDLTEEKLIEYINRVKQAVPGIPVTSADVYGELLQHPAVMNACDIVLVNNYPVWEGVSIDYAIYYLHLRH